MKRALLFLALLASACSDHPAASERTSPPEMAVDVRVYVPITPGDRWRTRTEPSGTFAHYGITATDALGHGVVHGTDRASIELVEVGERAAYLVTPEGAHLVPIVVAPLRVGASTRYELTQGSGTGHCTLGATAIEESRSVAGVPFTHCFTQRRVCEMPAGGGLPRATTITEDETYCPSVGRVFHRFRADPPLPFEGVSSDRRDTVVSFHVRNAPVLPATTSLTDRLIVLPSDVASVCGGSAVSSVLYASATEGVRPPMSGLVVPADAAPSDTLVAFALTDGPFVVEARPEGELATYVGPSSRPDGALFRSDGPPARLGLTERGNLVRITPNEACASRAWRIEPLLRSLLR